MSAPSRVLLGQEYQYKVTVTNTGPAASSSVAAAIVVSGRDRDETIRHRFGTVAAGHAISFTVTEADRYPAL